MWRVATYENNYHREDIDQKFKFKEDTCKMMSYRFRVPFSSQQTFVELIINKCTF